METHSKFIIFIKTTDFVSIVCIIISYSVFTFLSQILELLFAESKYPFVQPPPSLVTTSSWWTCAFCVAVELYLIQTSWYFYSTVNHSFIRTVYLIQMLLANKASTLFVDIECQVNIFYELLHMNISKSIIFRYYLKHSKCRRATWARIADESTWKLSTLYFHLNFLCFTWRECSLSSIEESDFVQEIESIRNPYSDHANEDGDDNDVDDEGDGIHLPETGGASGVDISNEYLRLPINPTSAEREQSENRSKECHNSSTRGRSDSMSDPTRPEHFEWPLWSIIGKPLNIIYGSKHKTGEEASSRNSFRMMLTQQWLSFFENCVCSLASSSSSAPLLHSTCVCVVSWLLHVRCRCCIDDCIGRSFTILLSQDQPSWWGTETSLSCRCRPMCTVNDSPKISCCCRNHNHK